MGGVYLVGQLLVGQMLVGIICGGPKNGEIASLIGIAA